MAALTSLPLPLPPPPPLRPGDSPQIFSYRDALTSSRAADPPARAAPQDPAVPPRMRIRSEISAPSSYGRAGGALKTMRGSWWVERRRALTPSQGKANATAITASCSSYLRRPEGSASAAYLQTTASLIAATRPSACSAARLDTRLAGALSIHLHHPHLALLHPLRRHRSSRSHPPPAQLLLPSPVRTSHSPRPSSLPWRRPGEMAVARSRPSLLAPRRWLRLSTRSSDKRLLRWWWATAHT